MKFFKKILPILMCVASACSSGKPGMKAPSTSRSKQGVSGKPGTVSPEGVWSLSSSEKTAIAQAVQQEDAWVAFVMSTANVHEVPSSAAQAAATLDGIYDLNCDGQSCSIRERN